MFAVPCIYVVSINLLTRNFCLRLCYFTADVATLRRLMEYSQSCEEDILVHLIGGVSRLWSQLRDLSWAEVERVAKGEQNL